MPSVLSRSVWPTPICQVPALQRRHLLRDLPHRRQHQAPGQFGRRVGRRVGVHVRRHDDAEPRAGRDVDMRIDAALADQLQLRQLLQQRRADLGALADQHQRLGILQPFRQRVGVLDVIVEDGDVVALELGEARQRPQRVEVIVEDGDLHAACSFLLALPLAGRGRRVGVHKHCDSWPPTPASASLGRPSPQGGGRGHHCSALLSASQYPSAQPSLRGSEPPVSVPLSQSIQIAWPPPCGVPTGATLWPSAFRPSTVAAGTPSSS